MKLRKKRLLLVPIILLLTTTSCRELYVRDFIPIFCIYSELSSPSDALIVEYEDILNDTTYVRPIKNGNDISVWGENYYGNVREDYFPEGYIEKQLSYMTIYRYKGHEIQYLPRKYYDEKEDFVIRINQFFSDIEFIHSLFVTESMFEE